MPIAIRMIPTMPAGFTKRRQLERPAAGDQVDDQNNDRDDQQQMDQGAAELTDETEKPENQENNEDSPEHMFSFWVGFFCFVRGAAGALKVFQIPGGNFKRHRPAGPQENKLLAACGRKD